MHPNTISADPPEALSGDWVRAAGILLLSVDRASTGGAPTNVESKQRGVNSADSDELYAPGQRPGSFVRGQRPGSFLLMKHADRWDLPKGHCDGGESFLQTALREMEEETGLGPESFSIDPQFTFDLQYRVARRKKPGAFAEKWVRYFLGWTDQRHKICLTEHIGFRWWTWAPPHKIQTQTIDPLLAAAASFLQADEPK